MATRLFEDKEHASYYKKYRVSPPQEIQDLIISYLHERLNKPYELAVDVGCGTGQSTTFLASHFENVLGIDISEAQIVEAKKTLNLPNTTFRVLPAEEVPVDDASVDLLTACAAVHWFDTGKFLKEVDRILKPCGCLSFFTYLPYIEVYYKDKDRSEQISKVISEVDIRLSKFEHEKVNLVRKGYKDIFEAIPYTDKLRRDDMTTKITMPLSNLIGFFQSFAMFQNYHKCEPENAKDFIKTIEQRSSRTTATIIRQLQGSKATRRTPDSPQFKQETVYCRVLEIMEVSSSETEVDVWLRYVVVLASKPK